MDKFEYDPEDTRNTRFLRLPFALCKQRGIEIQDWWRPRDAWEALRSGGYVNDPGEEMRQLLKKMKQEEGAKRAKERRKERKERADRIRMQESMPEHMPEKDVNPSVNYFANAPKGRPMTHEEADSGNVNPFYGKGFIGYLTNCQTCVAAYIARRKGWDVTALPNLNNRAIFDLSYNTMSIFSSPDGGKVNEVIAPKGARKSKFLSDNVREGEVRAIAFKWKGVRAGHTVIVTRGKGGIELYDPQANEKFTGKDVNRYLWDIANVRLSPDLMKCGIRKDIADKVFKGAKK